MARHRLRRPAALLMLGSFALTLALAAIPASPAGATERVDRVLLVVEDKVSLEQLLSVPVFRSLASAGGVALMTTRVRPVRTQDGDMVAEVLPILTVGDGTIEVPTGGGRPTMNAALGRAGVSVCFDGDFESISTGDPARGLLAARPTSPAHVPCSAVPSRSSARELSVVDSGAARDADAADCTRPEEADMGIVAGLRADAAQLPGRVEAAARAAEGPIAVVVVAPSPSCAMDTAGDEVTPLIVATGTAEQLLGSSGSMRTLASDTTRRTGLVSNVDVAPTILGLFGVPVPASMDGVAVRQSDDPAPFHLHALHLQQRRIRLPIQFAELAFVVAAFLIWLPTVVVGTIRGSLPSATRRAVTLVVLGVLALFIPLEAGGLLPHLTYLWVVPFLAVAVLGLAALAMASRSPGRMGPLVFLGAAGATLLVLDAAFGWRGAAIPLFGGTMFDGVRFYGLPNAFEALLLASALFVAVPLPRYAGLVVLFAAGLFAGFPGLGADLGGAITIFFAAGVWWFLESGHRLRATTTNGDTHVQVVREGRFRAAVVSVAILVAGTGAVLAANRWLTSAPTHITRFETSSSGDGVVHRALDRLSVGWGQLRDVPAAWIPMLGLLVILAMVLTRRPAAIGRGLEQAGERWRSALIVLCCSGIVAFLVNDTGVAAGAPLFLYAIATLAYVSLRAIPERVPA